MRNLSLTGFGLLGAEILEEGVWGGQNGGDAGRWRWHVSVKSM